MCGRSLALTASLHGLIGMFIADSARLVSWMNWSCVYAVYEKIIASLPGQFCCLDSTLDILFSQFFKVGDGDMV